MSPTRRVMGRAAWAGGAIGSSLAAFLVAVGCAGNKAGPTSRPATAAQRSDRALKDPFGYSPDWSESDIGGGGTADLDRKGFNRDLDHVIMP